MASTGVDWIPRYDRLESAGFQVLLVDPRHVQRAPNRPKTDVHDCQWLQRLPSLGLRTAAGRPEEPIRGWRSYQRPRASLIEDAGRHLQRMGQALEQRTVTRPAVVRDLTGLTGLRLLRAIGRGERAPHALAPRRAHRGQESVETIARALRGTWPPAHGGALQPSLALYDASHAPIRDGARGIEAHRKGMAFRAVPPLEPTRRVRRRQDNAVTFDARQRLHQVAGVDGTAIEGSEERTALVVLREVGPAMRRWPSEKPCGSGLGLAPHPPQSGGRVTSRATRPGSHRAAPAVRLAAPHLPRRPSAWGACCRRIAARRGVAKAITATADTLARMVYAMRTQGMAYVAQGLEA